MHTQRNYLRVLRLSQYLPEDGLIIKTRVLGCSMEGISPKLKSGIRTAYIVESRVTLNL